MANEYVKKINNSIIIKPVNSPVIQEDLVSFSNLIIRPQLRSAILQSSAKTIESASFSSTRTVNFLKPRANKDYFTTDWTDDVPEENFGIDSIDLTFDANYIPRVNINFKDVRGKALFDNLDLENSPFVNFLSLPYPLFELELKGFYGKATSILLSLLKFNTKFNSTTGNFESVGNFVGLNFGFLSDIPVYFGLSAPYMVIDGSLNGESELKKIYEEQILSQSERDKFLIKGQNGSQRYYTFLDLVRVSKNLNSLITSSIDTTTKDEIKDAIQTISELTQVNKSIALSNNIDEINTLIEERKLEGTDTDKQDFLNALNGLEISIANKDNIVKKIDKIISDLDKKKDELKQRVFADINKEVEETFGINFTIENVFRIIINSFEVFFRLLNATSNSSAENLKKQNIQLNKNLNFIDFEKQFPWPKWVEQNNGVVELAFPDFTQYPYEKKFVDAFIEASINTIKLIESDPVDFNNSVQTFNFNPTTQQFFGFTQDDKGEFTTKKIAKLIYSSLFGLNQTFKDSGSERFPSDLSIIATYAGKLDADNIYNNITKNSELSKFRGSQFDNLTNFNANYSGFTSDFKPIYNSAEKETFYIEPDTIRDFTISNIDDYDKLVDTFKTNIFPKVSKENVYTYSFDGHINKFINILLSGSTEIFVVSDYQDKLKHLHFYINLYYNPDVPSIQKNSILEKIKITFFSLFFTKELETYVNTSPTLSGYLNINRRDAALLYANYAFYEECEDKSISEGNKERLNISNLILPIYKKNELIFSGTTFFILNDESLNNISITLNEIRKKYLGANQNEIFPTFEIQQRIYKETLLPILQKSGTTFEFILGYLFTKVDTYEELFQEINKDLEFNSFMYLKKYDIAILKEINLFTRTQELIKIPESIKEGSSKNQIYAEYKNSFNKYLNIDPTKLLVINLSSNNLTKQIIDIGLLNRTSSDEKIKRSNNIYREVLLPQAYKNYTPELSKQTDVYYITEPLNVFDFLNQPVLTTYFDGFRARLRQLISQNPKRTQREVEELKLVIDSDDIKLSLYLMFKNIHDKWFYHKQGTDQFAFRFNPNAENKNKTLFDLFDFVDRGNRLIGKEAIIDITFFNSYLENTASVKNSLYNLISELLSGKGNQWNFYVLPSYFTFGGQQNLTEEEIYETIFGQLTTIDKNVSSAPKFLCQYIGGTSTSLDIESANFTDDGATETFLQESDVSVVVFEVDFGNQDQGIFKSIQLDQAEYRETSESLLVVDRLAQTDGSANIQAQSGNLYNVYSNRSYTAKIEMAGNMMILPSMYFKLNNVPMYKGYYLITKVSHTITQGSFSTSIEGVRIPLYRLPIVKDIATLVKRQLLDTILEIDDNTPPTRISNSNINPPVFGPAQSDKYGIAKQGGQTFSNKEFIGSMIVAEGGGINDANNKAVLATIYNRAREIAGTNATHEQILSKMANAIVEPSQFEPWKRYNQSINDLIKSKPATQPVLTLLDRLASSPPTSDFFTVQNVLNYSIDFTVIPTNANDSTWSFRPNLIGKQIIDFKDAYYFLGIDSQSSAKRGLTNIFFNSFRVGNFSTKNNPLAIASIKQGGTSGPLQVYFKKS